MASTLTLARRALARALTVALTLALIALPAQARADAGDEATPQSAADTSTAAQSASLAAPSASPSPETTDVPEPTAPASSDGDRAARASSESDDPPTMGAQDETGRGTWMRDSVGWWWRRADGTYPASQWVRIGGARYFFNDSGYMATGWLRDGADWFFLAPSGALVGGWLRDGGSWYYLDPASGVMRTGMTGVDGTWYCLGSSGAMRTGWERLADGWHYFASNGAQMGGWLRDGGQWYYLDPDTGVMRTAPLELNGRRYEFDASGAWRGYEAPAGYLQPTDHITGLGDATNTLTWGMNGTKVRIAQVRLGLWHSNKLASVDAPFVAAVKNFQQRAGLPVTGVVDKATWDAMDTGYPWTVDQYQATPLPLTATRSERVEAMIGYAWNQTGSSYTWGGAGPYDQGFDCSGLVLQSLYAAGLDPQPIDVIKHAWPSYRTSQELYAYPRFQHVPLAQRQRGDLIFYTTSGTVTHVAIYLGDDMIVHTDWMGRPARMQYITAGYGWERMTPDVVRPWVFHGRPAPSRQVLLSAPAGDARCASAGMPCDAATGAGANRHQAARAGR